MRRLSDAGVLDNVAAAIRCRDIGADAHRRPRRAHPDGQPSPSLPAPADIVTLMDRW